MLVATVVLSFGAALGLSALVFTHALGFEGADPSLPLFVFVFLVALGIDYNIFLMTRVHEESKVYGTRRGALIGVAATGGVITSAGLVLAGTFAVLATLPVVAFAEIGIAVALGVLLDTIVVRSVLVTALNLDIGRHLWWPSKLAQKRDPEPADNCPKKSRALTRRWLSCWFSARWGELEVGPDGAPDCLGVLALGQMPRRPCGRRAHSPPGSRPRSAIGGTEMAIHPVPEFRQSHACPSSSFGGWSQPPCWGGCCPPCGG